ncbi:flagellar hook-basal body complex protein FliE [uncultured Erythrobacter sp.]|uniref:flagellar hook-basal body complex protein FliE n=1 Tax=uncultured Erythrobacter sp. TaxID=263913 RepID=UPI002605DEA9|nr:flagellar hook-basal body complex protein FliE [uncultured Erythrobacter sp.]
MNGIEAISSVTSATQITMGNLGSSQAAQLPNAVQQSSDLATSNFGKMMSDGIANVDGKVARADDLVARFVVDNTTPIHHVTVALEEARMAVELATQVRQRLTEGYRQLMNMQL